MRTAESSGPAPAEPAILEIVDLFPFINETSIGCLNESSENVVKNIFPANKKKSFIGKKDESFLESEADEQLLIDLPFKQNVKIHSIAIKGPQGYAPKGIKLYCNQKTMNFDDLDSGISAQEIVFTENQVLEGTSVPLKIVKFQNVNHLTIFVESNIGGNPTSKISSLILFGTPLSTTNVQNIKT